MRSFPVALCICIVLAACQQAPQAPIVSDGTDAAALPVDAGQAVDAASFEPDAGGFPDASSLAPDAGEGHDAGPVTPDAGEAHDAGPVTPDAGEPVDAGIPSMDAGSPPPPACTGRTVTAGSYDWTLMSGGIMRQLHVHIPPQYDPSQLTPVVFNFHGVTSSPADIEHQSQMTPVSDEKGFIVVYPAGVNGAFNAGACCEAIPGIDDVGFTRDMIDYLATQLCIDPARIYATGLSNGGMMAYRLACELSDRIAAIAPVAAVTGDSPCTPKRPVPVLHFHGTADAVVPYTGLLYQSVASDTKEWLMIDQCADTSHVTYQNGDATCETHDMCATPNMEVTLCTLSGDGHTWPDGDVGSSLGKTSHDIDADRYMWTFFTNHPMP